MAIIAGEVIMGMAMTLSIRTDRRGIALIVHGIVHLAVMDGIHGRRGIIFIALMGSIILTRFIARCIRIICRMEVTYLHIIRIWEALCFMVVIALVTITTVVVRMGHVANVATNAITIRLIIHLVILPNLVVGRHTTETLTIRQEILTTLPRVIVTTATMLGLVATVEAMTIRKAATVAANLVATTTAETMIALTVRGVATLGTTTAAAITGTPIITQAPVGIAPIIARRAGVAVAVEAVVV